jgi:hypothetical protein
MHVELRPTDTIRDITKLKRGFQQLFKKHSTSPTVLPQAQLGNYKLL